MARYEFDIARHLSLSREGSNSPAVAVATAAVALSVAIMLVAVAVVLGFREEITRKLVGFNSQITLYPVQSGESASSLFQADDPMLDSLLCAQEFIVSYSPSVSAPALLKTSDAFLGGFLLSIGANDSTFLAEILEEGSMPRAGANPSVPSEDILISRTAANSLGLASGDSINTYFLGADVMARRFRVAGIYNSHLEDFDSRMIFAPLSSVRAMTALSPGEATMMKINVDDMHRVEEYSARLQTTLNEAYLRGELSVPFAADTIERQGANFFVWLSLIDTNVWVILILMTIVSAFSLIAAMLIIILEKVRFIGVMRALGARASSMRRVFVWLALRIGLKGMAIGTAAGLLLIGLQAQFHLIPLNAQAYYMDFVPVHLNFWIAAAVEAGFALVIYLILALPSFFVSKVSPAESMRFDA